MAGPSVAVRILGDLKDFSSSLGNVGKTAEGAMTRAHNAFSGFLGVVNRTGVLGPFGEALSGIDEAIGKVIEHGSSIGTTMIGVGGALAGVGVGLQALGSKDKAAHQQLVASVEATGKAYDDYADQVEGAIKKQEKYGTTANTTQDALRVLTQAMGDPQKALDNLGVAADLAKAKHEDLATAAGQVGKAYGGSAKLLKEFGISTKDSTGAVKDHDAVIGELAAKLQGQAAAGADTFAGKLDALKAHAEDSAAAFGQKYGPALTAAGAVMAGLGAVIETTTAITKAFTASEFAASVAEYATLGPILLIIAAVALLGVGIYELVKHWSTVWSAIQTAVQAVWNWIKSNWPLLLGILLGPIATAVVLIVQHWQQISNGARVVIDEVRNLFNGLVGFIAGIPGRIGGMLAGMFDSLWQGFRGTINRIIDGWNGLHFGIPAIDTHIPGIGKIGGESVGVPQIPRLAQGGLITATGFVFAHAGEAITPYPGRSSPAVNIEHAEFATELDVEAFMRRAAWVVKTAAV
jgi:ABC-type transporter Mla subunit MlaD